MLRYFCTSMQMTALRNRDIQGKTTLQDLAVFDRNGSNIYPQPCQISLDIPVAEVITYLKEKLYIF